MDSLKRRYIFMPSGISEVGGGELYILNKSKWLTLHGWEVHVLSASYTDQPYKIKELDVYRKENMHILNRAPFECTKGMIKSIMKRMLGNVGGIGDYEETIIESHTGAQALWGELLAEEIKGKHVILLLNETFDDVSYKEKLDFFEFKYDRHEVFGGLHAFQMVYGQKREITEKDVLNFGGLEEDPVQDVEEERLSQIQKADYTICYIGRVAKSYVPNVFKGVAEFASSHADKSVQFVVTGDPALRMDIIESELYPVSNLKTVLLGDVFPLPRTLFKKVDTVIAGSGSAKCAAYEGLPAIVADPDNNLANGVLGYDVMKAVGREPDTRQRSFAEALEEVLIREEYKKLPNRLPPKQTVEECCLGNFESISESEQSKVYYGYDQIRSGNASLRGKAKAWLSFYCPRLTIKLKEIKTKREAKK